ncbi:MAG: hypothetical protein M1833_007048 [Piccolia ochrophora]|nr:MAG: hypothetical protein M1833_007048 [Piccolia ochrophora]
MRESRQLVVNGDKGRHYGSHNGYTNGERPPMNLVKEFVCDFANCSTKTKFTRQSEFRKHMDRHFRPYKCDRAGCDAPAFGDAGGLFRHQREVHKTRDGDRPITEYMCPELRCERHKRGFPRRWNLMEHQRRVHGLEKGTVSSPTANERRIIKQVKRSDSQPSRVPSSGSDDRFYQSMSSVCNSPIARRNSKSSNSPTTMGLLKKLEELELTKKKLEGETKKISENIQAVKHTLDVFHAGGQ